MTTQLPEQLAPLDIANSPLYSRELTYQQTMICAAVIGIAGGLVATIYYNVLEACLDTVWHTLPALVLPHLPVGIPASGYVLIVTTIGGFCVGLTALFALEIPHRRGLEYYEALIPAVLSAILSFFVFRFNTGLTIGGMYHFPAVPPLSLLNLGQGALLGAVGALTALLFVLIFRVVGYLVKSLASPLPWRIEHHTILLATVGGLSIGLIALVIPQTLFFGEKEITTIIETGSTLGIQMLLLIAVAKMLAVGCTLHSGFRGGFIFRLSSCYFISVQLWASPSHWDFQRFTRQLV